MRRAAPESFKRQTYGGVYLSSNNSTYNIYTYLRMFFRLNKKH